MNKEKAYVLFDESIESKDNFDFEEEFEKVENEITLKSIGYELTQRRKDKLRQYICNQVDEYGNRIYRFDKATGKYYNMEITNDEKAVERILEQTKLKKKEFNKPIRYIKKALKKIKGQISFIAEKTDGKVDCLTPEQLKESV